MIMDFVVVYQLQSSDEEKLRVLLLSRQRERRGVKINVLERERDRDADATHADTWSLKHVEETPHKQHVLAATVFQGIVWWCHYQIIHRSTTLTNKQSICLAVHQCADLTVQQYITHSFSYKLEVLCCNSSDHGYEYNAHMVITLVIEKIFS